MKNLRKFTSLITTISVVTMVLFGIFCPQLRIMKMDHGSCSNATKMYHLSSAGDGGCLNLHTENQNLPSIIPDSLTSILALVVLVIIYNIRVKFGLIAGLLIDRVHSRWRYSLNVFELDIKPVFLRTIFSWLNFISSRFVTVS